MPLQAQPATWLEWLQGALAPAPKAPPLTTPAGLAHAAQRVLTMPLDPRSVSPHNPHFVPLKNSTPIPLWAALLPPLAYFCALTLLPPFEKSSALVFRLVSLLKFTLASISIAAFAVLPFKYHVPGSAVLSYQLGLVGCYGACRSLDLFFLSHPRVPRRLAAVDDADKAGKEPTGALYPSSDNEQWPVKEHPRGISARLWWALDLMISMRGVGWDFATPDVRHDTNPWQSPSYRQVQRAFFRVGPVLIVCLASLRWMVTTIDIQVHKSKTSDVLVELAGITRLPVYLRPVFVAATGVSLYALFDFGYTLASAAAMPLLARGARVVTGKQPTPTSGLPSSAHNVDFYPLLNPLGLRAICSVRSFWSKAWHRLFHRAFLIYGIVPFQNMAIRIEWAILYIRALLTNSPKPPPPFVNLPSGKPTPSRHADPGRAMRRGQGDWGKVLGAFVASGVIHAISERAALGGRIALPHMHLFSEKGFRDSLRHAQKHKSWGVWSLVRLLPPFSGAGELSFFVLNGLAVIVETAVARAVLSNRRKQWLQAQKRSPSTSPRGKHTFLHDSTDEHVKHRGDVDSKSSISSASTSLHDNVPDSALHRPYDLPIQLLWTLTVLLYSGELFVEGWIASGVINEITMMSR